MQLRPAAGPGGATCPFPGVPARRRGAEQFAKPFCCKGNPAPTAFADLRKCCATRCGPATAARPLSLEAGHKAAWPGAASVDGTGVGRYLVDPASSHMLVSRIKPCMSKYKHLYRETANGSLKQLWFIWWFLCYLDNRSNSRANTCTKGRLTKPCIY